MAGFKFLSEKQMRQNEAEATRSWLGWLGPTHQQRIRTIETVFEQRQAPIWATCFVDLTTHRQIAGMDRARNFSGLAAVAAAHRAGRVLEQQDAILDDEPDEQDQSRHRGHIEWDAGRSEHQQQDDRPHASTNARDAATI